MTINLALAQSFKKGTLLIGISEGSTLARYTTSDVYTHQIISEQIIKGLRDPFQIEYGLSNKWGLAISFGNDIFKINPQTFYRYNYASQMKSKTSESILEVNYHFYNTQKWDIALFAGIGCFKTELFDIYSKYLNDSKVVYDKGRISRTGVKLRYYLLNRLSLLAMLSAFNGYSFSDNTKLSDDIPLQRIQTSVKGVTLEFGLSYRVIK